MINLLFPIESLRQIFCNILGKTINFLVLSDNEWIDLVIAEFIPSDEGSESTVFLLIITMI